MKKRNPLLGIGLLLLSLATLWRALDFGRGRNFNDALTGVACGIAIGLLIVSVKRSSCRSNTGSGANRSDS